MKILRADVVLGVLSGDFGKPRPLLVVQTDTINDTHPSILVCPITSHLTPVRSFRLIVTPTATNGLVRPSEIMVDKVSAILRNKITQKIGTLSPAEMRQVEQILMRLLHLN